MRCRGEVIEGRVCMGQITIGAFQGSGGLSRYELVFVSDGKRGAVSAQRGMKFNISRSYQC